MIMKTSRERLFVGSLVDSIPELFAIFIPCTIFWISLLAFAMVLALISKIQQQPNHDDFSYLHPCLILSLIVGHPILGSIFD